MSLNTVACERALRLLRLFPRSDIEPLKKPPGMNAVSRWHIDDDVCVVERNDPRMHQLMGTR